MSKFLAIVQWVETTILSYTLLAMAILTFVQVFQRYVIGSAFSWVEELVRYLMILMTFWGASLGIKYGVHFGVDAFVHRLPDRWCHLIRSVVNLLAFAFCVVIFQVGWGFVGRVKAFQQVTPTLNLPMYWIYWVVLIGFASMAIRFFSQSLVNAKGLIRNEPFVRG
jgi:C4-dicarboxylate transporter DctQ subunit